MSRFVALLLFVFSFNPAIAQTLDVDDVSSRRVGTVSHNVVRLDVNPVTQQLYYLTTDGTLYHVDLPSGNQAVIQTSTDHGVDRPQGMAFGPEGNLYLVGNVRDTANPLSHGLIRRGVLATSGEGRIWETLAASEPYPETRYFDHLFNAIAVSPDGANVFVNSGAATDHGEDQSVSQNVTAGREYPVTTKIFRLPADGTELVLHNNLDSLKANGYLYADGVRNTFSLAFDGAGRLLSVENAGDRDDPEEINQIQEGHHYGFPWRIGNNDTPQQFSGFSPESDPFINPNSWAASSGFFYDDPSYPAAPDGVTFTDPIPNLGPDADIFRDPTDGVIKDGSDAGITVYSLTPHRSPLGLVFDTEGFMGGAYTGNGFVTSWTGTSTTLMAPFNDSEDILHLRFTVSGDNPDVIDGVFVERIASGFSNPVDMALIENRLYLIENAGSGEPGLYELTFPAVATAREEAIELPESPISLTSFPNPARGTASFNVTLTATESITVTMYNIRGRKVADVAKGTYNPATYSWNIDVSSYPSGSYIIQVETPTVRKSRLISIVH